MNGQGRKQKKGLKNITFEVAGSTDYPGDDYDLVTFFDCFHDMGNPSGAATHVLQTLKKKDGTWMIVEPFANDKVEDNLNPVEGYSTLHLRSSAFLHL